MSSISQSDAAWKAGQAHPDVTLVGDPVLRRGGQPVVDFGRAAALCERMTSLLRELNGAGLAAPQIGIEQAVVVIEVRKTDVFPDRPESPLLQMVNPTITWSSDQTEPGWEGCFSIPGLMGVVSRPDAIRVRYSDPNGTEHDEQFHGYVARVIQHEIDHLAGITFLDRMDSLETLTTVENYTRHHASRPLR